MVGGRGEGGGGTGRNGQEAWSSSRQGRTNHAREQGGSGQQWKHGWHLGEERAKVISTERVEDLVFLLLDYNNKLGEKLFSTFYQTLSVSAR